jgi:hypothetical protein
MTAELLHLQTGTDETRDVMRAIMDPKHLLVYDLALQCEEEMLKCSAASAYFAGCLMGAAMNEALLSLLCMFYEDDVKNTSQYARSTKKGKPSTFRKIVGTWGLDQFINVAEQLSWIPNNVVAPEFVLPLSDAYRELAAISHPELLPHEIERRTVAFRTSPGSAMLRMLQDLRNTIHSGKWIRGERALNVAHLDWCRIAIFVSAEIRSCLLHLMVQRNIPVLEAAKARFDEAMEKLRSDWVAAGREPADFERMVREKFNEALEDKIRHGADRHE